MYIYIYSLIFVWVCSTYPSQIWISSLTASVTVALNDFYKTSGSDIIDKYSSGITEVFILALSHSA